MKAVEDATKAVLVVGAIEALVHSSVQGGRAAVKNDIPHAFPPLEILANDELDVGYAAVQEL